MNPIVLIIIIISLIILAAYGLVLMGLANAFQAGDDVSDAPWMLPRFGPRAPPPARKIYSDPILR